MEDYVNYADLYKLTDNIDVLQILRHFDSKDEANELVQKFNAAAGAGEKGIAASKHFLKSMLEEWKSKNSPGCVMSELVKEAFIK